MRRCKHCSVTRTTAISRTLAPRSCANYAHRLPALALLSGLLAGCAAELPSKSVESLDENTGMTRANLLQPMAFVETGTYDVLAPDKQPSVVYLGPEEWDRSGNFSYVLWAQVAPGVDGHRLDDIRSRGALVLKLDDGSVSLHALDQAVAPNSPYAPIPPVGQAAYFSIDVGLLKRMASSRRIVLDVRAGDLTMVDFVPRQDAREALKQFMIDREIAAD